MSDSGQVPNKNDKQKENNSDRYYTGKNGLFPFSRQADGKDLRNAYDRPCVFSKSNEPFTQ